MGGWSQGESGGTGLRERGGREWSQDSMGDGVRERRGEGVGVDRVRESRDGVRDRVGG